MNALHLRTALLWLLAKQPGFGVQLSERLRALDMVVSPGNLYPALRALERSELVSSWEEATSSGGRPRRYFKLTKSGRRAALLAQKQTVAALKVIGTLSQAA